MSEYTHRDYAATHDAPAGYEWTGEYSVPNGYQYYLANTGKVEVPFFKKPHTRATHGNTGYERHILYKVAAPVVTPVDAAWATGSPAPAGFEYTGEFRPVKRFDRFLKKDGTAGVGQYAGEGTSPRHILKSATTSEEEYHAYRWRGEHPLHGQLGEPPKGYEFTGEFREPTKGEKFACNNLPHSARTGPVFPSAKLRESRRWILRRLPPELPAVSGVTVAVNRNGGVSFPITLDDYLFTAAEARLIAERLTTAAAYAEQR